MADEEREQSEEKQEASPGVGRFLYRLALAGVGGVVLAQEEISGLFQRKADDESEESTPVADAQPTAESEATSEAHSAMEATIDRVLHTLNLPSRTDVDELNQKLDELQARVEALRG